jgi:hypothetical protein
MQINDVNRVNTAMELDIILVSIAIFATEQAVRSVTIAADEAIMTVLHAVAQDVLNGNE